MATVKFNKINLQVPRLHPSNDPQALVHLLHNQQLSLDRLVPPGHQRKRARQHPQPGNHSNTLNFHGNNEIQVRTFLKKTWCVTLHVLVHYFLLANYFWMFCEGLYLHTLLVYAFTRAEETLLKMFIAFAWAGPSIPITLYTVFRARDPDLQEHSEWVPHI
jgi:hypothetical protein